MEGQYQLLLGDVRDRLKELPDNSVDSIVTDAPYELDFMGKRWDSTGISYDVAMWKECLRVLKPGGHLLSFGGSRTYHRMACAIEDAGFQIRDQIMWLYGSGFPKSMDVSKAIDKAAGAERRVIGTWKPTGTARIKGGSGYTVEAAATDAAKKWDGWGTALKPAHEPIVLARKPLIGTVAANVLEHGTGALNIKACRVPGEPTPINKLEKWSGFGEEKRPDYTPTVNTEGRWPANLIHDGSDEVMDEFAKYGEKKSCMSPSKAKPEGAIFGGSRTQGNLPMDSGTAARFFYCAKANKKDRGEGNDHPTVKPTELMRYLCRLITPPGGVVLDPFVGSGSTAKAAILEGFRFIGIDNEPHHIEIAERRAEEAVCSMSQAA